jgi:hypothetical protein
MLAGEVPEFVRHALRIEYNTLSLQLLWISRARIARWDE